MKKRISIFLCLVLIIFGLTACGENAGEADNTGDTQDTQSQDNSGQDTKDEGTADNIQLTVAWWGNQVRNQVTQDALDYYTELNPNITFDGQFSEWADYWNKLATSSAGNSLPDIIQQDYKYIDQYVQNDLLVDLTPYIESGVLDVSDVDEGILESGKINDGIYAICIGVNAPSLAYNKTLLEEADIEIKDNMTIDEFIDICREVYEKTGYKTHMAYGEDYNFIEYYLRAKDKVLFEADKLGVDSAEEFVPFFELYELGMEEGWHLDPSVYAEISRGSVEQNPLVYGSSPENRSWCTFSFSNQVTAFVQVAPEGMEIDVTTWPSDDPVKSGYLKPGQFFSVTTQGDNPEEAVKVLDYWTNSLEANEILLAERGIPASAKVAEALAPKLSETENLVIDYINNVVTPNSSVINPPGPEGSTQVAETMNSLIERICYGQMTAEEAAEELFTTGNEALK